MSVQALRHHAMAVAADIVPQSPCDSTGIKSIRWRARLHASLAGRTAEQVLELALTQERAGQERARQAERDRRSKHPSKGCHPNRGPLIQNRWWHLTLTSSATRRR
jgi:hypothetical protein